MDEGYAIEWRMKMPSYNGFNKNHFAIQSIFFLAWFSDGKGETPNSDGTYLIGYNDFDDHNKGSDNGSNVGFDYIKINTARALNNYQRFKLRYSKTDYRVYYNDTLRAEVSICLAASLSMKENSDFYPVLRAGHASLYIRIFVVSGHILEYIFRFKESEDQ